jgi:hypothetical protein
MRGKFTGEITLILFALLLVPTIVTAQSGDENANFLEERISVEGVLQSLENVYTAWMYGTHVLMGSDGKILYALESDSVDLDTYEDELVTVVGIIVHEGLSGGPPLLKVERASVISEPTQEPGPEPEPEPHTGSDFYLSPNNPISVEVLLNMPGVSYDLKILENAKNVGELGPDAFLYRSHYFENLGVIVYESSGLGVPGGGNQLSVRLSPKARRVTRIVGYETGAFEIPKGYEPHQDGENLPSLENLQVPGWSITTYEGRGFKAEYKEEGQVIILSKLPMTDPPISTLSIRTKEKIDGETEENILSLLSKVFYLDESDIQKVKDELANMKGVEMVELEPVFNFTDDEARETLKTELMWLSDKGIIEGLGENDLWEISEKVKVGYAGVNNRLIYKDGEWISYRESGYPLIREADTLPFDLAETSFPAGAVEITGEGSENWEGTNWMLVGGVLGAIVFGATAIIARIWSRRDR